MQALAGRGTNTPSVGARRDLDRSGQLRSNQGGDGCRDIYAPERLATAAALLAGAVGTGGAVAQDQVEFDLYDLHHVDPGKTFIQSEVDAYMAAHPNVKINLTVLENTALKDKIAAEMQSGNPPDLFQSWGGGTLAQQVEAGLVRPIDDEIADVKDSIAPAGLSHDPGRRRAVRPALQPRRRGHLVQQGPLRPGGHRCAARDVGRVPGRRPDASRTRASCPSASRPRPPTPGRRCSGGPISPRASAARRA